MGSRRGTGGGGVGASRVCWPDRPAALSAASDLEGVRTLVTPTRAPVSESTRAGSLFSSSLSWEKKISTEPMRAGSAATPCANRRFENTTNMMGSHRQPFLVCRWEPAPIQNKTAEVALDRLRDFQVEFGDLPPGLDRKSLVALQNQHGTLTEFSSDELAISAANCGVSLPDWIRVRTASPGRSWRRLGVATQCRGQTARCRWRIALQTGSRPPTPSKSTAQWGSRR